ncbi:MAG: CapA family protein [Candidatus Neomarinimicrobiota bacterium]
MNTSQNVQHKPVEDSILITMFLGGDVMTGRGIDQVLPHPNDPVIHEPYMESARRYVDLAIRANGPIQQPVSFAYIWGDALVELERIGPDLRIVNLETSITNSDDYWEGKGINYRMHPENIPCLTAAGIDYCALANNHILDWGYTGLIETLETLGKADIEYGGAGRDKKEAETPAVLDVVGKGRVIVFSYGTATSGIPSSWVATNDRPGVNLIERFSDQAVRSVKAEVEKFKQRGDIVVVSIHWGDNWGYSIPPRQRQFAHRLIDQAGVDVIHGHSSHHVKGIEVYRDKLIIYGCGDFLNDYEGIGGYKEYRADLTLMYFVSVNPATGKLAGLQMTPTRIRNFRIHRAPETDARWLQDKLNREGQRLGTRVILNRMGTLTLHWD